MSMLLMHTVASKMFSCRKFRGFICAACSLTCSCLSVIAVCRGLIKNGERQDEESVGGRRRTEALRQLCQMNPSQALNIRAMVVSDTIIIITQEKLHGPMFVL